MSEVVQGMREVKLPSGAVLGVKAAPFPDAKALYQAILRESKGLIQSSKTDMAAVYAEIVRIAFSSEEVEAALWKCMVRCTYNRLKIDNQTFEPIEARDDYMQVCIEVGKENVFPFLKSLYAEYGAALKRLINAQT